MLYVLATGKFPLAKRVSKGNSKGMFDAICHDKTWYPRTWTSG